MHRFGQGNGRSIHPGLLQERRGVLRVVEKTRRWCGFGPPLPITTPPHCSAAQHGKRSMLQPHASSASSDLHTFCAAQEWR